MGKKRNNNIKILFVGMGQFPMYEKAFYEAAKSMENVESDLFTWQQEIKKANIFTRAENKLGFGPDIIKLNQKLLSRCRESLYNIIFLYTCRFILPGTVKRLKNLGCYVALYCNDNPFSDFFPNYFWRHWRNSIKYCNITYVYRPSNIEECGNKGGKCVKLLRSYYIDNRNYYIPDDEINMDVPEVVFLGHRENDEREECLHALINAGICIGLPDLDDWKDFEDNSEYIVRLSNPHKYYNEIINKAKIALVFLSKINHDTYTRRCFEIPAVKTLMMSVYTEDIASLFRENKEVIFFREKDELVEKVKYYLSHDEEREEIAIGGYTRVKEDGHSAFSRVLQIIDDYKRLIENTKPPAMLGRIV